MATCVIECAAGLQKSVGNNNAAASLRPRAMPTDIPKSAHSSRVIAIEKPGPSYSSLLHHQRGRKRSANLTGVISSAPSSWNDDAIIQSMASKLSNSTISGPTPKTSITSANDPSDVLLHQLTQVCEQAQKTAPSEPSNGNKLTINTVLEADKNSSTLKSTKLAQHFISCFVVGGEIRLCSPQIYSVIMKEIHEDDIMRQLRQFSIIDHMASSEQLTSLKLNRAIPPEAGVCGLMTKTNAERLVGALIDPVNYRSLPEDKKDKFQPVLVEHDCFGGCEGRLYSTLYPGPCIECIQCKCLMTTEAFCRHSHQITVVSDFEFQEQQAVCHWGFDAANWAKYIRLHQLAERDQESIDQFHSFLKNRFLQEHDTLEDNLEVLAKKTMISAPFSAMAAQLLAQQQQQHHQASTSSAGGVPSSAPSSLPNSSFIPPPSSVQSSAPGSSSSNALHHQQSPAPSALGTNPLLLLQQQSPQLVQQLQSIIQQQQHQQQQQQQQTQANPMAVLMAAIQQQQFQSAISALRGAANVNVAAGVAQPQMNDESEIPRKRAHTISDPSATVRPPPKQEEFALSSISFGLLPADQQLLSTLSQFMDAETLRRVTDHMNLCIAQRVQPIADENANLRRENQRLKEENTLKNDVLARIAAVGMQQQQQRNHFPSPLAGSSTAGHHHHHQQHPQQIAEQDSDIEIDDH